MKLRLLTLLFSLCLSLSAFSQAVLFEGTPIKTTIKAQQALSKQFKHYDVFQIDLDAMVEFKNTEGVHLPLNLKLGNKYNWTIDLYQKEIFAEDYVAQVHTEKGVETIDFDKNIAFGGYVVGNFEDEVYMTISEDYFGGMIEQGDEEYYIEPFYRFSKGASKDLFVVYKASEVKPSGGTCGSHELHQKMKQIDGYMEEIKDSNSGESESMACYEVEYAIAGDVSMVNSHGSIGAVIGHTTNITLLMQTNYDDEFVHEMLFIIVTHYIATGSDPWNSSVNGSTYLSSFRSWGNTGGFGVSYDLAGCWTDINFHYQGNYSTIGLAYGNGLCGSFKYHLLEDFTSNNQSLRVLTAHEIGHNFNAGHNTPSCGCIMDPSLNITNTWSGQSTSTINAKINSVIGSCLTACAAAAPPAASFTVSPSTGCAPMTVQCTDQSTNGPTFWNYTVVLNGAPVANSTQQNPSFNLVTPGCYEITLIATNGIGSSAPFTQTVVVQGAPTALFSWVNVGTEVSFFNLSIPNDPCLQPGTSWLWNFGDGFSSNEFEPTHTYPAEGFWNVTLVVSNGCGTSSYVEQIHSFFPPVADFVSDVDIGCVPLEVTFTSTSSVNTLNHNWSFPGGQPATSTATSPVITYPAPGLWNVELEVCNPAGCDVLVKQNYIEVIDQPLAIAGPTMLIDCNNTEVELDGTLSSSGNGINYLWTTADGNIVSGEDTATPTVDAAGTYCIEVTNSVNDNCIASDCVMVIQDTLAPLANAGPNKQIDCDSVIVILDGTASSQNGNFSYKWDGPNILSGDTTLTPEVDLAGTYVITVTNNDNGCTSEADTEVTGNSTTPTSNAGPNMAIDCTNPEATLDGSGSSQGTNYTYSWTGPGIVSGETTLTPIVNLGGTYVLVVTDTTNNCTESSEALVDEDLTLPTANAGTPQHIDCTNPEADLDGTASSQGANFNYNWTGPNIISGANTLTPTVGGAGTYSLVVTNTVSGCTETADVTVTGDLTDPTADAGASMVLDCTTTSVSLDGTNSSQGGNFTYAWAGPSIVSGGNTLTPEVDGAGTYTLTVTNTNNGCTSEASTDVTGDNAVPIASAGAAQQIDCANAEVDLDGTGSSQGGGETYSWNGPGIVSGGNTLTPVVNAIGTYIITVTGSNGCTSTSDVEVTESLTLPTADAGDDVAMACSATSLVLNGTNSSQGTNFSYNWTGPAVQSGGNTLEPTVGQVGTYTLTVTNTDNSCTAASSVEVTETPPPASSISAQSNVDCNGNNNGEATVEVTGGLQPYAYEWSSGGTTETETGLTAGTYDVTVTDADQCTSVSEVIITEPAELDPNASATNLSAVGSNDGTATADPMGGTSDYTYAWDNGETTQTIEDLAPGEYTVTVTDANNCTSEQTVTVDDFDCSPLGISVSGQNALCFESEDGEATATITNGNGTISYEWSNGSTEQTATDLPAGTYTVTATDEKGCALTEEITIDQPTLLEAGISSSQNVDCNGNATGSATATAAGGTPGYSFAWPSGGTEETETDLEAGAYIVTITDLNGCESTTEVTISQPDPLAANQTSTNESEVGANDGTATANPSGGTSDYTYLWDTGATTQTIENLAPGEYCVTVTDANGCTTSGCTTVNSFDCGNITNEFDVLPASCFGSADGEATVNMSGGTAPYTYEWSNSAIGQTASNLAAGEYQVTATDDNNCVIIGEVTVPEPEAIDFNVVSLNNVACEGGMNGAATIEATGGTPGFSYEWSNGTSGPTIEDVEAGTYTVTATDINNCTSEETVEIGTDDDTEAPNVITQDITITLDDNGNASITVDMINDGSADNCELVSLSLDMLDFNCDHVGQNTVTLTGTDAAGNTASQTAVVTVEDVTAPNMDCPDDIVTNNCASPVVYDVPVGDDLCGTVTVSLEEGLASGSVFPSGTTTVTWSGTDPSGNQTTCSFDVTVNSDLGSDADFSAPDCAGEGNGTATSLPDGGTPPYTYEWNDPTSQVTQTAENLFAGIYSVTVTDAVGCQVAATVEVTQPDPVEVSADIIDETNENMDGAIDITPTGGTNTAYTFEWTQDGVAYSTEEDLTNLSQGEYCVTITDENGCTVEECYTVAMIVNTNNPELEQLISILPNPTSGLVNVNFKLNSSRDVQIQWFDYIGRMLIDGSTEAVSEKSFTFDLSDMPSGVYLVRVRVDNDVLVKKVIVE